MENKRMAVFAVMMLTIGNLMVESEAVNADFPLCYIKCYELCILNPIALIKNSCPPKCLHECGEKSVSKLKQNKIDQTDYFCKVGCVMHRCVSVRDQDDRIEFYDSLLLSMFPVLLLCVMNRYEGR
ncbi:hypothetical protein EUTSA_v10019701mg [Eutrema salsugineum]|uniref:Acidic protein n=1 Tax=Eutrema salsugineum TaxID=72664 RepID=V4KLS6_EUTSA|nr:hypothetical protein EUTSA_v10019701mg [Eutrema salsugineum]